MLFVVCCVLCAVWLLYVVVCVLSSVALVCSGCMRLHLFRFMFVVFCVSLLGCGLFVLMWCYFLKQYLFDVV